MAKANLQKLLGHIDDTGTAIQNPIPSRPMGTTPVESAGGSQLEAPNGRVTRAGSASAGRKAEGAATLFSALQRKETRIREDQQNALTLQARRLSKAKGVGGRRITDNTLIRVAIDLLLARSGDLQGTSEDELRRSVGL